MVLKGLLVCVFVAIAQTLTQAQCTCEENFEFVYTKTKINYAGWKDKTSVDPTGFEKFTNQQRQKSKAETQKNYCYKIIQDWLDYFQDHHTHLYSNLPPINLEGKSENEIRNYFSNSEKISPDDLLLFDARLKPNSLIEGIWDLEGNYRIAIIKNKTPYRDFVGIVLESDSVYWMRGQVKLELEEKAPGVYSVMYYMRDHSLRMTNAKVVGNHELRIDNFNSFWKVYPLIEDRPVQERGEGISTKTEFRKLNASTLYFRLPTFNHLAKNKIDSLIQANHDLITDTPNLILDVRNNGGGSDVTYAELIQYLYTNKIILVNNSIWSSKDNIQKFEKILDDPEYPKSGKGYIKGLIKKLKANPNAFVRKDNQTIRKWTVLPFPKNVVILINSHCGSSCEEFVLAAQQSKKVTLMGENTMGVLDYANVHHLDLPCEGWALQYATSRTNRLPEFPIDNIGISPNIKIAKEKNWVEVAMEYLKNK